MQVTWTESAANQAKVILANEEEGLNVRCFIQGGGCSGFQYGFTLDEQKEDDHVFETNGTKLLIDPMSGVYFHGATIDYVNDPLQGSMFTISNPNAKSTCGCGSSAAF
jgi:iron-sulfur cluster insertion protein|tara:strand:+ start:195 stop:518 length:324 start_codon:yes stop_codon:yes gene_type:complete